VQGDAHSCSAKTRSVRSAREQRVVCGAEHVVKKDEIVSVTQKMLQRKERPRVPVRGFFLVIDAQKPDSLILECSDVIRERAPEAKGNSAIDLRIKNIDFVTESAQHDGERTILGSYSAVEERSLKLAGYDADFFARFSFGVLGAAQLAL
jgi:hypothetical protein